MKSVNIEEMVTRRVEEFIESKAAGRFSRQVPDSIKRSFLAYLAYLSEAGGLRSEDEPQRR